MAEEPTGQAVVEQAQDKSFWNTDPAIAKAAVTGLINGAVTIGVVFGVMTEDQREPLTEGIGQVVVGGLVTLSIVVPIVQGIWTRLSVWSPKHAAAAAVENYHKGRQEAMAAESVQSNSAAGPTLAIPEVVK